VVLFCARVERERERERCSRSAMRFRIIEGILVRMPGRVDELLLYIGSSVALDRPMLGEADLLPVAELEFDFVTA
jgi:hypothetical protein